MGQRRWNHADDFILGRRGPHHGHHSHDCHDCHKGEDDVKTEVSPTRTVVNPTTNRRTIRRIHPTHIKNINKNITRIENYYPVSQSTKDINIVEEYDCGSDVRNPRCRRVDGCDKGRH